MKFIPNIIPEPVQIKHGKGTFKMDENHVIFTEGLFKEEAQFLKDLLIKNFNLNLSIEMVNELSKPNNGINLSSIDFPQEMPEEGYELEITSEYIMIKARTPAGGFHGIQTLRQLIPIISNESLTKASCNFDIPCVEILDYPRFKWRGFLLDEARHFFGGSTVKKMLNLMSLLKLNKFHWHLTDDQGWRIEIKKYPLLTKIGSKRKRKKLHSGRRKPRKEQFSEEYSGFYTKSEIKEIIEHARKRHITIIPEIDVPGHVSALLAAYPQYCCEWKKKQFEVSTQYAIHEDVLCAGKKETYHFLHDILNEIIELFPSKIIHIGGDEVPKIQWQQCSECQALMKKEKLNNEEELQVWFTNEISNYLNDHERIPMGWNEILNKKLVESAICQYWTPNLDVLLQHVKKGRVVVMSEFEYVYLNYGYKFNPLDKVYQYDPIPKGLEYSFHEQILGIEACLWTEFIPDQNALEWYTFPRLIAVAETGWTIEKNKNFEHFMEKLPAFLKILEQHDVRLPEKEEYMKGMKI